MASPDPFMAGFAAAVAAVVRQHDEPTVAADAIAGYGLKLENFKGVDQFDLKVIRELFKTGRASFQPNAARRAIWRRVAASQ